jgi:molecular chaperone GrpE|tara:strand:+ start:673 stop:1260 length:588 start_codon:yes stop_codon:yes gene_type:complete
MEDPNEKTKDIEYPSDSDSSSNTEENPTIILLKEELEKALAEVENFKDIAKRAQSDLINFKRRADDEKTEQRFSIKSSILLSIITILDDFTLAMDMLPEDTESETWLEGIQIIHRKIENLLESQMVTKIDAIGKHFQPWEFEALQYKETKDCEENIVVEVIKEGYKFNGQILRPAQVIVSKAVQIQEDKPQEEIK